jgi:pyruvate/2-oxoacid:ferredoxin oxidoreductase beta subunit
MRHVLKILGKKTIVVMPACCWGIIAGPYPTTALQVPLLQVPFAAGAACAAGVRQALDRQEKKDITVMVWAGDGGTFDIGLQALSCAAERNEDLLFVCYDNEAYMNTGIQRSSATPRGAWTTTTPEGESVRKKDIVRIVEAHRPAYVATAAVGYASDFRIKLEKAKRIHGFRFIHLFSPCPPGWRIDAQDSLEVMRLAVESGIFPLMESDGRGQMKLTYYPKDLLPVRQYFESQGRFKGMPHDQIEVIQKEVEEEIKKLGYSKKEAVKQKGGSVIKFIQAP